jgi:Xaa-Pro aminopeptidase
MKMSIFSDRCRKAQARMHETGIDYLFVSVGSDMFYLTGYSKKPSERLSLFVLPKDGEPSMVTAKFEAARLANIDQFYTVRTWDDAEDPMTILRTLVNPDKKATIGIDDQIWGIFVLRMQSTLPEARFVSAGPVLSQLRIIKDSHEISRLREMGRKMDKVYEKVVKLHFTRSTELDLAEQIQEIVKDQGLKPEYHAGVASGPNGASPHHSTSDRVMEKSDGVWMELGCGGHVDGYWADKTRSVQVAPSTDTFRKTYEIVREAQQSAFEAIRPGVTCESIDAVGRRIITEAGYGEYFSHRLGHGLGLDIHEPPYIVQGNTMRLQEGMVFSDEPGIYLPGEFGIRIEDIVAVTKDGAERFYDSTHELIVVK